MTEETEAYSSGDWIVHRHHGVGQIVGFEVRQMGGRENNYCRIETQDSTIWMPQERVCEDCLRPLATPAEMQQAIDALRGRPRLMDADVNKRKIQISDVKRDYSILVIAELLRDLSAFNKEKKQVSQSDAAAVRYFTALFLSEWAVSMKLEMEDAKRQFHELLSLA